MRDNGFTIVEILESGNYFQYIAQELMRSPYIFNQYYSTSGKSLTRDQLNKLDAAVDVLREFNDNTEKSEELLCYGYFVLAEKEVDDEHSDNRR